MENCFRLTSHVKYFQIDPNCDRDCWHLHHVSSAKIHSKRRRDVHEESARGNYDLPSYMRRRHMTEMPEIIWAIWGLKYALLNSSLLSPSFQGGPTIFHTGNFLKLKGVVLPHLPFLQSPPIPWMLPSLFICRDFFSFCPFNLVHELIAVPRARLKGQKEKKSLQRKREGSILGIGGLCKNL